MNRRGFVGAAGAAAGLGMLSGPAAALGRQPLLARVILDNDFAGDPDGLFQLAHHVLCRAVSIPLIIGSHLPAAFASGHDARDSANRAQELLRIMGLDRVHQPIAGAEAPIASRQAWTPSQASKAIVQEAMRADVHEPLFYAAGAGLTDLALAWLSEPRIGRRIKLLWIGGNTHPGHGNPGATPSEPEFNFSIDPVAAQVLFNESDIEIWQVPSNAYSQMLFSTAELAELGASGPLGAYLQAKVDAVPAMFASIPGVPPVPASDAYVLGDSPLVTLSALVPPMQPDTTSCRYVVMPKPLLQADGRYVARPDGRLMRVYTQIDAGLTFRDMLARFRLHGLGRL
ncbi:nucleoside hydrolase [Novosphingobium sp. FSY-8]|uniref:Nucleoside hydrolase n=1 Tax=Novosphingobium ovatum TaxID=1908523 RepID=A0ABW9X8Z4_9SPHN|nr:nucleoside hydrolase [Novosphingobium ovatum]NBC34996.1 nucleoside hydrolase [Novosphingobium ovatum]